MTIDECLKWQQEKPEKRNVSIYAKSDKIEIWVYDRDLADGQYVQDVAEINMDRRHAEKERKEFERLKAKFAANQTDDCMEKIMEDREGA